jgi:AcrR family transcriptional regulator
MSCYRCYMKSSRSAAADSTRERIIAAASRLLAEGGREAVSTRAVSAAAGVQAPAIYRLFGDKQGLLDAVASHGLAEYVASKAHREPGPDPVEDLRRGFDQNVEFGLANPAVYALMASDPRPGVVSPAYEAGLEVLAKLVSRIAEAGRLRVAEHLATQLITSAGRGTTLTLIALPEDQRDPALIHAAREAVVAAITTDAPVAASPGPAAAAVTLRAVLPQTTALTASERSLLTEWLDRIADDGTPGQA